LVVAEETMDPSSELFTLKLTVVPFGIGLLLPSNTLAVTTVVPPTVILAGLDVSSIVAAETCLEIWIAWVALFPSTEAVMVTIPSSFLAVKVRLAKPFETVTGDWIEPRVGALREKLTSLAVFTNWPLESKRVTVRVVDSPGLIAAEEADNWIALTGVEVAGGVSSPAGVSDESDPPLDPHAWTERRRQRMTIK
jgi:hypothetical protein